MNNMQPKQRYIIALDQGTTSSRALIFDQNTRVVGKAQHELEQIFPKQGWVEHDPMEIWSSQRSALTEVLERHSISPEQINAIGITNQRETTIVWDKQTGKPIYNAIVWQCRRTAGECEKLRNQYQDLIKAKTGLVLDPYFSASKIHWILNHVPGAYTKATQGELLFGTVDTWLLWKLTGGQVHATDPTNASRTMLYNIHEHTWDQELLDIFEIPTAMLPEVRASSSVMGHAQIGLANIPIAGLAGDQQASLFGQQCFEPGNAKNTYGTGCFLLMNTGSNAVESKHGLLTTLAIAQDTKPAYALEGSVFMGGAVIQWLRDQLGLIRDSNDSAYFADKVPDNEGVYLVPAFVGLGAPYWDPEARGSINGLTRGSNRNHIIRAALESIAYQSLDILNAMQQDAGLMIRTLSADGGGTQNAFLMQFQADMIQTDIILAPQPESSAFGAACLAGLATGFWSSTTEIATYLTTKKTYQPQLETTTQVNYYQQWQHYVKSALSHTKSNQPYPANKTDRR